MQQDIGNKDAARALCMSPWHQACWYRAKHIGIILASSLVSICLKNALQQFSADVLVQVAEPFVTSSSQRAGRFYRVMVNIIREGQPHVLVLKSSCYKVFHIVTVCHKLSQVIEMHGQETPCVAPEYRL